MGIWDDVIGSFWNKKTSNTEETENEANHKFKGAKLWYQYGLKPIKGFVLLKKEEYVLGREDVDDYSAPTTKVKFKGNSILIPYTQNTEKVSRNHLYFKLKFISRTNQWVYEISDRGSTNGTIFGRTKGKLKSLSKNQWILFSDNLNGINSESQIVILAQQVKFWIEYL